MSTEPTYFNTLWLAKTLSIPESAEFQWGSLGKLVDYLFRKTLGDGSYLTCVELGISKMKEADQAMHEGALKGLSCGRDGT